MAKAHEKFQNQTHLKNECNQINKVILSCRCPAWSVTIIGSPGVTVYQSFTV